MNLAQGSSGVQEVSDEPNTSGVGNYPRITVLICTFNEEANLPHVLTRIPPFVDEVLLVDAHSTDDTVEIANKLRPDIRVIYQPGSGKDDALVFGFRQARGDIIVTLDADGSTRPEEIPNFIKPLVNGYDFAKGSRFLHSSPLNMPVHRRFVNLAMAILANVLHGTRFTDLCSGYNAFWRTSLARLNLADPDWCYEPMILMKAKKAGLKIMEVGHYDEGRIAGTSKLPDIEQGWKILKTILKERLRR